ncbi:MAG: hypothetical protein JNL64_13195 [Blastocatellia bacterium]|nr:hypothetical protein [Blastocatellia bacterium]
MNDGGRVFISSKREDVWHRLVGDAYERWSFNAISDDGREVVCISFYDHCPLSPRYYSNDLRRVPVVEFLYSVGGKAVASAFREYSQAAFSEKQNGYGIGPNNFRSSSADYGTGQLISIDLPISGGENVTAELEWLTVEEEKFIRDGDVGDVANVVTPRADVSGRLIVTGKRENTFHFRGTGCHSHDIIRGSVMDERSQFSGCAHFSDTTLLFMFGRDTSLLLITSDGARELSLQVEKVSWQRNRYGMKHPREVRFTADDGTSLVVRPSTTIMSAVSTIRSRTEFELTESGKQAKLANGLTFYTSPRRLRHSVLRFFSGLGISVDDQRSLTAVP